MLHQTLNASTCPELDLELPLHPATDNAEHVAQLLDGLLGLVDEFSDRRRASEADVLQALTVATALRTAMAEVSGRIGETTPARLLDVEVREGRRHAA